MKNLKINIKLFFILIYFINFIIVNNAFSETINIIKTGKDIYGNLIFDGRERSYILHLPPDYETSKKIHYPLVIVLHGGGGNAENAVNKTRFSLKADAENFVVLYPNGSSKFKNEHLSWNSGNCCGYAYKNNIDDVGFIRELIDRLISNHNIDPKKVFVTGMSNGGMMSYRLGCELSDKIAAIAPVAGALNVECNPSTPVSVVAFNGTEDMSVLYNGGEPAIHKAPSRQRTDNSVKYAMDFWTKNNGCIPVPQTTQEGSIIIDTYNECSNGTGVKLYTIIGGGHAWLGSVYNGRGDEPTQEISATDEMWEFFKGHPKIK